MDIHGVVTTELVYSGLTGLTDWPLLATQTQCSAVHWNANAGGIRGWGVNSLVFPLVSSSQSVVVVCFTELLGTAFRYVIKNVALSLSLSLSEELRFVSFLY